MRYLPHTDDEIGEMMADVGVDSLDALFHPIPKSMRLGRQLEVPRALDEIGVDQHLKELADANRVRRNTPSFLGAGLYEHYVPHVVRQLILRSEFLTAYTPYQPEISQGTLKTIFEYQTMLAGILGMDVANASMYDGAQGAAEAALMGIRLTRKKRVLTAAGLHPEYRTVMGTYLTNTAILGCEVGMTAEGFTDIDTLDDALSANVDVACVVVQSPNFFGVVEPLSALASVCQAHKVHLVVAFNEPMAYGVLQPPGAAGASIVVGEGISLGSAIGFGGPSLGVFATQRKYLRQMPGRLAGRTVDSEGREGYVLTLSTREQHIRRERATSNICTNQGLCATSAAIYLALLGPQGMAKMARKNLAHAEYAKSQLCGLPGVELTYEGATFNEFCLSLPTNAADLAQACAEDDVLIGVPVSRYFQLRPNELLVAVTEMHSRASIDRLVQVLSAHL